MTKVSLVGIQTYAPPNIIPSKEILHTLSSRISDELRDVIEGFQINQRHSIVENYIDYAFKKDKRQLSETTTSIAEKAIIKCLEETKIDSKDIGLFIGITNTPDRPLPCMAYEIMANTGDLIPKTACVISMQSQGCSTLIKALEIAASWSISHPDSYSLIVVAEATTGLAPQSSRLLFKSLREIQNSDKCQDSRRDTLALMESCIFGDGAVALVLGSENNSLITFNTFMHLSNIVKEDKDLLSINEGGILAPEYFGFPHYHMDKSVPIRGMSYTKYLLEKLIQGTSLESLENIDQFLVHTGNKRIIDGVAQLLNIDAQSPKIKISYDIISNHGNLSASSIGFMISELIKAPPSSLSKILLISFGVGFSASSCFLDYHVQ